tara:strand:- start:374 stop:862 length:489 start_codon:yes stop_codon:yes gene_type:complete
MYYINLKTALILFKDKLPDVDTIKYMYDKIITYHFEKIPRLMWDIKMFSYTSYNGVPRRRMIYIRNRCYQLDLHRKHPEDVETGMLLEDLDWEDLQPILDWQFAEKGEIGQTNIAKCVDGCDYMTFKYQHPPPTYYKINHRKERNKEYHNLMMSVGYKKWIR